MTKKIVNLDDHPRRRKLRASYWKELESKWERQIMSDTVQPMGIKTPVENDALKR